MATEKRLIDANDLRAFFDPNVTKYHNTEVIRRVIDNAPTVNAVEVVRCRDCKHYHPYKQSVHYNNVKNQCCRSAIVSTQPDDFCSYGERKDND